jgi:hypothetical protein
MLLSHSKHVANSRDKFSIMLTTYKEITRREVQKMTFKILEMENLS